MASKNCCDMKKTVKYIVAAFFAAFTIVSCNKNETEAPLSSETHFVLKASSPETKTGIYYDGGTYIPYFQKDDEIGLFVNNLPSSAGDMTTDAVFGNTSDDGDEALFEGTLEVTAGDVTFYSFYPASSGKKVYVNNETVTFGLDFPQTQHPVYDSSYGYSFDPKADILIAKPATATVDDTHAARNTVDMYFARLSSVLRLCVNAVDGQSVYGERIKSVKIETSSGNIAGRIVVNPLTGVCTGVNEVGGSKVIEAVIDNPDDCAIYIGYTGANNVFLCTAPVTIPKGSTVTFTINTVNKSGQASHKIVKEVPSLGADIVFESSKPTVINLTVQNDEIGDPDVEDTTNYSGEWVIAGTHTNPYVLSQFVSDNTYPAVVAASIDATNEIVTVNGSKVQYKLTIAKITEGTNAGYYTIKDAGNKYLTATATTTSQNYLTGLAEPADGSYWSISKTDGVLDIIAPLVDATYAREIRVNHNGGTNPRFSCYKSTSGMPKVGLYPYSKVVESLTPAATPTISCEDNTITITCTTENATIYYELGTIESDTNTPTTSSPVYDSSNKPTITENAYIKAIAVAQGYENSEVAGQSLTYQDPNIAYYVKVTEAPTDWSGDYLIVYDNGDTPKVLTGVSSSIGQTANVTITNSKIVANVYSSYNIKIAAGTTSGKYTMKLGDVYLAYTNKSDSGNNNLYTVNSANADGSQWTLSVDDAQNVYNVKRYLRYNTSNPRFCCYTSGQGRISFYKLEDSRTPVTLSFTPAEPDAITFGDSFTEPTLTKEPSDAPVSYSVETSPADIATIDASSGKLNIIGAGTITVTATVSDVTTYRPCDESYTLVVNKVTTTIAAFTESEVKVAVNGTVTKTTTINPNTLSIVYTTSDSSIASINASTGEVTGKKDGTVTISATFAGNNNYKAATPQTYSLKVGTGGTGGTWITEIFPESGTSTSYAGDKTVEGAKLTWHLYGTCGRNGSDASSFEFSEALTMGKSADNTTDTNYEYANFQSSAISGGVSKLKFEYIGNGKAFKVEVVVGGEVVWSKDDFTATATKQESGELTVTNASSNAIIRFVNTSGARRVTIGNISWQ